MKEAIILAGGMGTRLRETIPDLPKPMAPVNGKPFLFYLLTWLKNSQVEKIILSAGYRSDSIFDYFGRSFSGIPLEYAVEHKQLGTGGAVRFAMKFCESADILALNGDTYFPVQINRFLLFHTSSNNHISMALKPMKDFSRYGSVDCNGDIVTRFNEKKACSEGLINGGIYIINRNFFQSLDMPEVFSIEKDVLEKQAEYSRLKCMVFDEPFIDIGIPEDYLRAGDIVNG